MANNASIFISCVSDEFAYYRDAIRHDLTLPDLETKIQEDFIAFGGATLEKLDEYIRNCDAVIHIAGDMTGSMANERSLQYIVKKYPDFGARFPVIGQALKGETSVSYTQWEAYLAAYHEKRLFVVTPTENAKRSDRYKKDDTQIVLQRTHLNNLREIGHYNEITFSTKDELIKELFRSKLREIIYTRPENKVVNLPYKTIGSSFKGREIVMKELREIFLKEKNGAAAIAVHGLGGMGKTRLAVEYAWQHLDDYNALLFITAASSELLKANIANLSDQRILNLPERGQTEEGAKYAAVINWLNKYPGWLLVIDNADTEESTKKIEEILAQLQQGHVLITTRIDTWSMQVKKKRLDLLNKEDAKEFLLETTANSRAKTKNDIELAGQIADDLGCLALALEQARAYIVTKELSFEKYRKSWEKSRSDILSWYDTRQMLYPKSIAITWQTSFTQLSSSATTLLNRLVWLAPEPIPKTLLETAWPDIAEIDAQSAWEELKKYSLATSTEDKTAFTIHKLVQDITRGKMDEALKTQTLDQAINWMDHAFTGDVTNINDWPDLEPLTPHILALADHTLTKETTASIDRLTNDTALMFLAKAQYKVAEPLMRRVLETNKKNLGPDHPGVAIALNNLAQLLKETNRYQDAEPLMKRALEIDEQNYGPNHPKVAIRLNNLSGLLQDTNRWQAAEPLMKRALEIDEQNFGPDHPNVARRLNNLALLLSETNRLQEAEPLIRRALEISEKSLGTDHPNIAIRLNNLAQLLQATDRLTEAEPLMIRALEIDEKNFGPNHPNVARDLNNLAMLFKETGRIQNVELLLRRALKIDEESFGPVHPNVAIDLNNLAQYFIAIEQFKDAEPLLKRSLIIIFNSLGADHPSTKGVSNNYVSLLKKMGRPNEEIRNIFSSLLSQG